MIIKRYTFDIKCILWYGFVSFVIKSPLLLSEYVIAVQ